MEQWMSDLRNSVTKGSTISQDYGVDGAEIDEVCAEYPMRIPRYYYDLIREKGDPIWMQSVPSSEELHDEAAEEDPLHEDEDSPVPRLTHRYPDRVLLLVTDRCPMYCRFCTRKRMVGRAGGISEKTIALGIEYIRSHPEVRDVLLSGGDPLLLADSELFSILTEIRAIPHVEIIRIGTRVPCTLPQRVTSQLAEMLKAFQPLYINTHFNHPWEITPESALACSLLADAGIPLGCQTVLLKGVNDDVEIMRELMIKLLTIRVRPYYLFQADLVKGTSHFWTGLKKGIEIMAGLQGYVSGMCIPRFMIDLPDGGGKVPVTPDYIKEIKGDELLIKNYLGREFRYPVIKG